MPELFRDPIVAATREWLEALGARSTTAGSLARYGDDLALATMAGALVDADREREGVLLRQGELTIERLSIDDDPDPTGAVVVDLDATIVFPPDISPDIAPEEAAPGRALPEMTVRLGSVYFEASDAGLVLVDYTRDALRMSEMWCTHPEGEDARGGLAAVPQAVTLEAYRGGRVFIEVTNALDRDVVLRIGRPDRPRGLFSRQPAVEAPSVGLFLPAGGSTHFAGLTRRSRLTEVEIFAFDAVERTAVAALLLQVELPKSHPGELGQWCG